MFGSRTTAETAIGEISLKNVNILITGANSGIGKETARVLAKHEANVFVCCRDATKCKETVEELQKLTPNANISSLELDLNSFSSIKKCASDFQAKNIPLHILINNAGIMACPYSTTVDGFESQFGTNHLGHFYLTKLLLDRLREGAKDRGFSRIVNLSSAAHTMTSLDFSDVRSNKNYSPWSAYARSKLANVLFTMELHSRLKDSSIQCFALHPGLISTNLARNMPFWQKPFFKIASFFAKSIEQGAATTIVCATSKDVADLSGRYFQDCRVSSASNTSEEKAKALWELSEKLVQETETKQ